MKLSAKTINRESLKEKSKKEEKRPKRNGPRRNDTYLPERDSCNHRICLQRCSHNSLHNRHSLLWIQMACRSMIDCIWHTQNRCHASGDLCRTNRASQSRSASGNPRIGLQNYPHSIGCNKVSPPSAHNVGRPDSSHNGGKRNGLRESFRSLLSNTRQRR